MASFRTRRVGNGIEAEISGETFTFAMEPLWSPRWMDRYRLVMALERLEQELESDQRTPTLSRYWTVLRGAVTQWLVRRMPWRWLCG